MNLMVSIPMESQDRDSEYKCSKKKKKKRDEKKKKKKKDKKKRLKVGAVGGALGCTNEESS